jgi:streptogramin lyase
MAASWKVVGICLAATLIASNARAGGIFPFPSPDFIDVPTQDAYPNGITTGPLGDIWFTENGRDKIGRIAPDRHVDEFAIPHDFLSASPTSITLGPDGNLWFIESNTGNISRITPAGTITQFPVPSAVNRPVDITSGPDGKLWFTEQVSSRGVPNEGVVGNITVNGTINETRIDTFAYSIARGPDNALWFTTGGLGRFATNGQYRLFPTGDLLPPGDPILSGLPPPNGYLPTNDVTAGPDGALWFTYFRNVIVGPEGLPAGGPGFPEVPVIGRMTTDGELTSFVNEDNPNVQPNSIIRGPEDNLWFTTEAGGIWRINLAGTMAQVTFDNADPDPSIDLTAGGDGRIYYTLPMTNRIGYVVSLFLLPLNLGGSTPLGLTRGQDDSVWFADYGGNRIGRIDKNGSLQQFERGTHNPTAVAVAPDGSAWFTNPGNDTIGHITADGDPAAPIVIENGPSTPLDIVLGPDGNFWFTEYDAGAIGRITPQSVVVKRFPIPNPNLDMAGPRIAADAPRPVNITVGPDGNLWFTDEGLNKVGRLTISGDTVDIVEFPIPTADSAPAGITAGADGTLYFVESNAGRVARITTAGVVTELGTPDPDSFPQYITLGPDGAIWFTESDVNRLGRIARDGRITHFELPTADSGPTGIVGRGDGRLFVALLNTAQILYTDLAAAEPTHTITPTVTATRTRTPTRTVPPGSTATSTPPATHTPTVTETPTITVTVPPGSTATETPEIIEVPCIGDCDGDDTVTISELISAVNIALGNTPIEACMNADAGRDGEVRINDLIIAVTSALQGCPL